MTEDEAAEVFANAAFQPQPQPQPDSISAEEILAIVAGLEALARDTELGDPKRKVSAHRQTEMDFTAFGIRQAAEFLKQAINNRE